MHKESLRNFGTFRQIFVKILQTIYLRTLAPNFPDAMDQLTVAKEQIYFYHNKYADHCNWSYRERKQRSGLRLKSDYTLSAVSQIISKTGFQRYLTTIT